MAAHAIILARISPGAIIPLFIIGVIVFVIISLLVAQAQREKRREAVATFAARHQFQFAREDPLGVTQVLAASPLTRRGRSRKAENFAWGDYNGRQVILFQYQYTVSSGKSSRTCYHRCCLWRTPQPLGADVVLRPQGFFDGLADLFRDRKDIVSGDPAFDDAYHITGADEIEVHRFLTPDRRSFLLQHNIKHLEVFDDVVLFYGEGYLDAVSAERLLALSDLLAAQLSADTPSSGPGAGPPQLPADWPPSTA